MPSISIYKLYEVTTQANKILNTFPDDTEEIILHGHYIYLYNQLNPDLHLHTKEEYSKFQNNIQNVLNQQFDASNQLHTIIRNSFDHFFKNDIIVPNYDSCRQTIDLGRFKHLKNIQLSNLYLYKMNNIPNGLTEFNVQYCYLKKIENIPSSLKYLYCNDNQLTRLPHLQHTNIIEISFKNNNIYQMPNLPDCLKELIFNNNQIMNIPNFPKSLKYLECSWNRIHNLKSIPKGIHTIICHHNDIRKLPCLSELYFLKTLICNSNEIAELPPLPGLIEYIDYSDNPIILFVPFPYSLIE